MTRARIGLLISGGGSNMQAIIKASRAADYPAEVACVVSNRPEAGGLKIASAEGITTHVVDHKNFATREQFDAALNAYLQSQNLDLIVCAGFMRIMTPVLIAPWQGRMVNIHPSLLPKYKGLHTHQRAIDAGDTEAGCSVHYVTEELDGGEVIASARVLILMEDTAESLAARVLVEEHKLFPKMVADVVKRQSNYTYSTS
jgi:phosphoribosylglycinamide formyltransferase 1